MRCDYAPVHIGLTTVLLTVLAVGLVQRPAQADAVRTRDQINLQCLGYDLEFKHNLELSLGFKYQSAIEHDWSSDASESPRQHSVPLRPIRLAGGPAATGVAVAPDFLKQVLNDTLPNDKQPQTELAAVIAEMDRENESSGAESRESFYVFDYQTLGGVFTARELESDLDVLFSGDVKQGDNPVQFRSTTGRLQVSLQFDAPLLRLGERNSSR